MDVKNLRNIYTLYYSLRLFIVQGETALHYIAQLPPNEERKVNSKPFMRPLHWNQLQYLQSFCKDSLFKIFFTIIDFDELCKTLYHSHLVLGDNEGLEVMSFCFVGMLSWPWNWISALKLDLIAIAEHQFCFLSTSPSSSNTTWNINRDGQ